MSYSRWSFTTSFALFIIGHRKSVDTAPVLLLPLCQCLKQISAFEAHFADAPVETGDAKAFGVIIFIDFYQTAFELDTFLLVRCLH